MTGTGTCLDAFPTYPPRKGAGGLDLPNARRPLTALRYRDASSRASLTLLPTRRHVAQEYFDC